MQELLDYSKGTWFSEFAFFFDSSVILFDVLIDVFVRIDFPDNAIYISL